MIMKTKEFLKKANKKGKIALDILAWLILGIIVLVVLVIIIIYLKDSLYEGARKFLKIFGESFGG